MFTYGIVGGSEGSFIADVHIRGIEATHKARLAAGCFSRSFDKSLKAAEKYHVDTARVYSTYHEMAEKEAAREDGIKFAVITTPNHLHYDCAKAFLSHGISVSCDKPVTLNAEQAIELEQLASQWQLMFCVTYTFSGLPALNHIRQLIDDGAIGNIQMIMGENAQDWMTGDLAASDIAPWRTDPKISGRSNCLADIGSHVEFAARFTSGLKVKSVNCTLDRINSPLDTNATVAVKYDNGAQGVYWASQIAMGNDNGLRLRIYGSEGSIEWSNNKPETFQLTRRNQPTATIVKSKQYADPALTWKSRLPSGHPEGWYYAFANIYDGFLTALGGDRSAYYPSITDGVRGMRFIDACLQSDSEAHCWVNL